MNKKGVTLIELIVVFVIIAIGAVLTVPAMGSWISHYRLRSATRDIASTLRVAQMRAVSINVDHRVSFTGGTGAAASYVLERNTRGVDWVQEGVAQPLPIGIQLATNFTDNKVVFRPNSSADQAGSVTLQNPKGTTRTITVLFSTGKITVQ